jgi:tetratricopeptide (TPR) repeat protein
MSFGRVVLVLMPYAEPIVFTRAWCLFEIYTTIATGSKFEVALNTSQKNAFLDAICDDAGKYWKLLGDIDVKKADAWSLSDKEQIFQAVERMEGGFSGVNGKICEKMRDWMITTLKSSTLDESVDFTTKMRRKIAYCEALLEQGRLEEALSEINECEASQDQLGEDKEALVGKLYYTKAGVYYSQANYEEALRYYEMSLDISLEKLGARHPNVAATYNNMAIVYERQANYEEALRYYEMALDIRLEKLGARHASTQNTQDWVHYVKSKM